MNENIQPVSSILRLEEYYFDESTLVVRSKPDFSKGKSYDFNFTREIEETEDGRYIVSLRANVVTQDTDEIEIHTRVKGTFTVESDDEKVKRILISKNTVSALFPFVRSQIILMTSQTGIPPVVLPVMNIAQMFPEAPPQKEEVIE